MGFRFQKRIKIFPGITINISKSGVSTSLGVKGATVNLKGGKARTSLGIPGTGLAYRSGYEPLTDSTDQSRPSGIPTWITIFIIGIALFFFIKIFS